MTYEPESSIALGFGFRCGFLGLLHMEIIQERLEREYNLDLITTAPNVVYRITKTDGSVVMVIDNPTQLSGPGGTLSWRRSPYVKASLMAPPGICGQHHGAVYSTGGASIQDIDVSGQRPGWSCTIEMPLNEIIYDFFDALKVQNPGLRAPWTMSWMDTGPPSW